MRSVKTILISALCVAITAISSGCAPKANTAADPSVEPVSGQTFPATIEPAPAQDTGDTHGTTPPITPPEATEIPDLSLFDGYEATEPPVEHVPDGILDPVTFLTSPLDAKIRIGDVYVGYNSAWKKDEGSGSATFTDDISNPASVQVAGVPAEKIGIGQSVIDGVKSGEAGRVQEALASMITYISAGEGGEIAGVDEILIAGYPAVAYSVVSSMKQSVIFGALTSDGKTIYDIRVIMPKRDAPYSEQDAESLLYNIIDTIEPA